MPGLIHLDPHTRTGGHRIMTQTGAQPVTIPEPWRSYISEYQAWRNTCMARARASQAPIRTRDLVRMARRYNQLIIKARRIARSWEDTAP